MKKKILLAEDSASLRRIISIILREAGFEIIEAQDGQEAIEKLHSTSVDMVISDLNMPRVDGFELTKHLRSIPQNRFLPIIMLTAENNDAMRGKVRSVGGSAWIPKPFKPSQLLNVVKLVLA